MSLARNLNFFREYSPLFRMLEEPLTRSPSYSHTLSEDPFFQVLNNARPAVDIAEEGNKYIVHADVPGVKKENLNVRIENGGRSVTIEGKVVTQRSETGPHAQQSRAAASEGTVSRLHGEPSNQISSERFFKGSSAFSRTVWLPRPVDGNKVTAKLEDGVLTLTIPKAEDKASIQITVE